MTEKTGPHRIHFSSSYYPGSSDPPTMTEREAVPVFSEFSTEEIRDYLLARFGTREQLIRTVALAYDHFLAQYIRWTRIGEVHRDPRGFQDVARSNAEQHLWEGRADVFALARLLEVYADLTLLPLAEPFRGRFERLINRPGAPDSALVAIGKRANGFLTWALGLAVAGAFVPMAERLQVHVWDIHPNDAAWLTHHERWQILAGLPEWSGMHGATTRLQAATDVVSLTSDRAAAAIARANGLNPEEMRRLRADRPTLYRQLALEGQALYHRTGLNAVMRNLGGHAPGSLYRWTSGADPDRPTSHTDLRACTGQHFAVASLEAVGLVLEARFEDVLAAIESVPEIPGIPVQRDRDARVAVIRKRAGDRLRTPFLRRLEAAVAEPLWLATTPDAFTRALALTGDLAGLRPLTPPDGAQISGLG